MAYLAVLFYNLIFPLGLTLYLPFYLLKLRKRGNWRLGFGERFGLYSAAQRERLRALQAPVWIHAVSVGETVAALTFIRAWQARDPGRGFVLTSTTSTGQQIARDKAPANVVPTYFPLDWWPIVRLALRAFRPTMIVVFEKEFWPTLTFTARSRGIPLVLANGMLSDRSWRRYAARRWLFGPLFRAFDCLCVQSETDAERLRATTGPLDTIHVCNTMKFDQAPDPGAADAGALLNRIFPANRVVLCAASTHGGEEAVVLRTFLALRAEYPTLCLVLVPRHHERLPEFAPTLDASGLRWVRRTDLQTRVAPGATAAGDASTSPGTNTDTSTPDRPGDVLVVNTTGEMMAFLAASDIVFVGNSLAGHHGGHNVIEPAIYGKAVITGVGTVNFRPVMDAFRAEAACLEVDDEAAFTVAVRELLADPARRAALGERARRAVANRRGAIARTLDLIAGIDPTRH